MQSSETDESHVRCLICGKDLSVLHKHLGTHGITVRDYKRMFPGADNMSRVSQENMSKAKTGQKYRPRTEEHTRKLNTPESVAKRAASNTGKKRSPEFCRTSSERQKGVPKDHGENVSRAMKAFYQTPEGLALRGQQSEFMTEYLHENPEIADARVEAMQTRGKKWRDTKPELAMRDILDSLALDCEPQARIEELNKPYRFHKWDFIIRDLKIAVEVDGCYWHAHSKCYPERLLLEEIQCQMALEDQRDLEADLIGWIVLRLWECEILEWPMAVAICVQVAVEHQRRMIA